MSCVSYLVGSRMVLGTLRVMTNRLLEWIALKNNLCDFFKKK